MADKTVEEQLAALTERVETLEAQLKTFRQGLEEHSEGFEEWNKRLTGVESKLPKARQEPEEIPHERGVGTAQHAKFATSPEAHAALKKQYDKPSKK